MEAQPISFANLALSEQQIVYACVKAVLFGPFIDTDDIHPRIGLEKAELESIFENYPFWDDSDPDSDTSLGINNCLNEICHTIRFKSGDWSKWFGFTKDEAVRVYEKWRPNEYP